MTIGDDSTVNDWAPGDRPPREEFDAATSTHSECPETASIRYLSGLQSLHGRSVHYNDAWTVAGDGPGYTWTVDNPLAAAEIDHLIGQPNHRRRIDYIFTGSAYAHPHARTRILATHLIGTHPINHTWLTDHHGLLSTLDLTTPTA